VHCCVLIKTHGLRKTVFFFLSPHFKSIQRVARAFPEEPDARVERKCVCMTRILKGNYTPIHYTVGLCTQHMSSGSYPGNEVRTCLMTPLSQHSLLHNTALRRVCVNNYRRLSPQPRRLVPRLPRAPPHAAAAVSLVSTNMRLCRRVFRVRGAPRDISVAAVANGTPVHCQPCLLTVGRGGGINTIMIHWHHRSSLNIDNDDGGTGGLHHFQTKCSGVVRRRSRPSIVL